METEFAAKSLKNVIRERVEFDPNNKQHLASFKSFLEKGKWGDVVFAYEFPYLDVETTCLHKLAKNVLNIK